MNVPRWTWALTATLAVGVTIGAAIAWNSNEDDDKSPDTTEPTTSSSTTSTSTSTSTTTTSTAASATTTSSPQGPRLEAVSVVAARPGGGSGEIEVDWDAVPDATGYRVLRSSTPDGRFALAADIDITTGSAVAVAQVINLWSSTHSYIPSDGPLVAPDPASEFQYVEGGASAQQCFRVVAYNEDGDAPPSAVVCGAPP